MKTLKPIKPLCAPSSSFSWSNAALCLSLLAVSLGSVGCAPLLLGGAAVATGFSATDRRTTGIQVEDQRIELSTGNVLGKVVSSDAHISVTSYNRIVLLTGEVPTEQEQQLAEQWARRVDNVRNVINDLAVMPSMSIASRIKDGLVTARVKSALFNAKDLQSNTIKVVTERGTVYLMGVVSEREALRATEVAREVEGVLRVVRVFEVVSEAELLRVQPRAEEATPAPAPTIANPKP